MNGVRIGLAVVFVACAALLLYSVPYGSSKPLTQSNAQTGYEELSNSTALCSSMLWWSASQESDFDAGYFATLRVQPIDSSGKIDYERCSRRVQLR